MKKPLLVFAILLFGLSGYAIATPVSFTTDILGSSVELGGTTSSSWFLGSATLTANLSSNLATEAFTLADGESHSFDFINFNIDVDGLIITGGDFSIAATLAFSSPADADVSGSGNGIWGTAFGLVSGGLLTWTDMPSTFSLLDGKELTIDFEDGIDVFCGTTTTIQATVTNNEGAPAPVPEPGTLLLLGSGLSGLALYRRKKTVK